MSTSNRTMPIRAGRSLAILTTTGLAAAGAFLAPGTALAVTPTSIDFSCTGAAQTWTVPDGVTSATFTLDGASGGQGFGSGTTSPGLGGELTATLPVTPGAVLTVMVGCQGGSGTSGAGGFNGGGLGGSYNGTLIGGGGGGATDIREGGTGLLDRVLVAGGGGGTAGTNGAPAAPGGAGSGGNSAQGGGNGPGSSGGAPAGAGSGGAGGAAPVGHAGEEGSGGIGGDGGQGSPGAGGGGGGGGGWFGGGGGGGSTTYATGGSGGGGGSGAVGVFDATSVTSSAGVHAGDGHATITFTPSAPVTSAPTISGSPGDGAVDSPYSFAFTTTGAPAPTCSVTGDLPPGIRLDPATCSLSGTPTAGGAYPVTVTASNGTAPDDTVDVTLTVTQPPSLSDPAIPHAIVGQAYSYQLPLVGYPTPAVSLTAGTLPGGLTLDPSGLLHGTPTAAGASLGLTLHLASSAGAVDYPEQFLVDGVAPVLTSGTPDDVVWGRPYRFQFTASGSPSPTFGIVSGPLPPGLSLDQTTGVLSGTPADLGDYPITVLAANGWGSGARASYTLHVTGTAPSIANTPPPAEVGVPYSFAFDSGSSNPAPTYTVTAGTLPAGLLLFGTGVIAGTPEAVGPGTPVTITAHNGVDPDASVTVTIPVSPQPPTLSGTAPAAANVGSDYYFRYLVSGQPAPTLSVTDGALPPGLTLDNYGELTGTPTTAGTYTFTITADDGATSTASVTGTVVVSDPVTPVSVSGTPVIAGVREPYVYSFTTTGDPVVSLASGRLPTGLRLSPSGVLSGTPTRAGMWTFTVRATGSSGAPAAEQVSLRVLPPPRIAITDASGREGDTGLTPLTFTVSLSRPSTVPVVVSWRTRNGTATAGSDYTAAHGVITFAPGQTMQAITVEVHGDRLRERDEQFRVVLSHPRHGWLQRAVGVGRIHNDD